MFQLGLLGEKGARHYAMANPMLRPIYNVAHTIISIIPPLLLLLAVDKKRKIAWVGVLLVMILGMLTGTRTATFTGPFTYLVATWIRMSYFRRFNFSKTMGVALLSPILLIII